MKENKIKNIVFLKCHLKVGDLVWIKKYNNEKKYKNKQENIYVVIKKTLTKIYVLTCISTPPTEINWKFKYYPLNKIIYNLDKTIYIYTEKIDNLPKDRWIKKIGCINEIDFVTIKKFLTIINPSKILKKRNLKFNYGIGDVIFSQKQQYYIYEVTKKYYLTFSVNKKIKSNNKIFVNNSYYTFNFNNKVKIPKKAKIKLKDTFNTGEIELITNHQIEINKKINQEKHKNFLPMSIITHKVTKNNYLIISREKNILELLNINDFGDYFYYLLENNKCPYKFYRTISVYEYEEYVKKIDEFKLIYQLVKKEP